MKMLKQLTLLFFFSFLTNSVKAQISIGGHYSYLHFFGDTGLKHSGFGIRVDYPINEKMIFTGGINYYLTSKFTDFIYVTATSSQTSPSQLEIDAEYTLNPIHFFIGGKRYLVGNYEGSFGLYILGEAGYMMAPTSVDLADYDSSNYHTFIEDGSEETLSNITINFGLGLEQKLPFGYIFADAKAIIPATEANGIKLTYDFPAAYNINAGVRIPFGN